jgi:hypothetical protein
MMDEYIIYELQTVSEIKLERRYMNLEWCNKFDHNMNNSGIGFPGYNNKKFVIKVSDIKSNEIRKYYINKYFIECILSDENLKLSDIDTTKLNINKEKQALILNGKLIKFNDISSKEILDYCLSIINFNNKDNCRFLLNSLKLLYERQKMKLNISMFKSISSQNQLYILQYIFSVTPYSHHFITNLSSLISIFSTNKDQLLELINKVILMKQVDSLNFILENKEIEINSNDYIILQKVATHHNLFDIMQILVKFESIDHILFDNNINVDI